MHTQLPEVRWKPAIVDERDAARVRAHTCGHREREDGCPGCWMADDIVLTARAPNALLDDVRYVESTGQPYCYECRCPLPKLAGA